MQKRRIGKIKVIILTVLGVLLLCAISGGFVAAKYINEKSSTGVIGAKNFYFTSNFLDGTLHTLAPGTTSVSFSVGNHEDDLRYSEVKINYTVTVDNGATIENGTGTLASGAVNDAEITVSGLTAGKTYTVTATGTGGYSKTLTATIVVAQSQSKLYYNVDNSAADYILLTVWNEGDADGNVTISYTGIPDNTNPDMGDWQTNGTSKAVAIPAHASKVFRFFGGTVTVNGAESKELY